MNIRPVRAEFFKVDGRPDGQTDTRKPTDAFCNFANAPKKLAVIFRSTSLIISPAGDTEIDHS
jgi:hypothetical protein